MSLAVKEVPNFQYIVQVQYHLLARHPYIFSLGTPKWKEAKGWWRRPRKKTITQGCHQRYFLSRNQIDS